MAKRTTIRTVMLALLLSGALAPLVRAQIEPLVVRVSDAEGEPGGPVAVVLRTYASKPVSQGRLGLRATSGGGLRAELGGVGSPFASFDGGVIFGTGGDVVGSFVFDELTQTLDAQFESASASINASDGVLGVLFFSLDPALAAGEVFTLDIDLGPSFLTDPDGLPMPWQPRAGELAVLPADSPLTLEVDGPDVHPGSGADVEIQTLEPLALASGVVELIYPDDVLDLPVEVRVDPRHGGVTLDQVTLPAPGRLRIEFTSATEDFNSVPGALFVAHFRTSTDVPLGTTRPLSLDPIETLFTAPGGAEVELLELDDVVTFESDPFVFYDNFEGGSTGAWSRRVP